MTTRLLALLLASPFLLLALREGRANHQAQPPKVTVSQPLPREVVDHTAYPGRVEPSESVDVRAREAGEVTAVHFKPGEAVKKGALLFQFDDRLARAGVEKAQAEMDRAAAAVKRAAIEVERAKGLMQRSAMSKAEFEVITVAFTEAEASLRAARATVEMSRLKLESTRVLAPISGRASRPTVHAGSVVAASSRLVSLFATDPMSVLFDLDEGTALRLIRGEKGKRLTGFAAEVGLSDESDYPHRGQADLSDLEFNPTTATATVRMSVPNPDGLFLPGLSARLRLIEGKPYKAMLVTARAFQSDNQGLYLLVVAGPGSVLERRYVKIGRSQASGLVPVKDGLKATDQVVLVPEGGRGDEPPLVVGMAVDPEKVAMPERSSRQFSPKGEKGFSPLEKAKMKGGKGKRGIDP